MRLGLHHDSHGPATAVPGLSPLSPLLPEESTGRGEAFSPSRPECNYDSRLSLKAEVVRLRFDGFELDEADARLTCAGQAVPLPPRPFAVLCTLARSPHMLVTKDALLDTVWGHRFVTDSVLKTAVSEVRAALGDDPKEPRYIETVSRRGYRFIASAVGVPSPQRVPVVERTGTGASTHPGLAALIALCRGDAAIGELIRTVAATLEREQLVLNDS